MVLIESLLYGVIHMMATVLDVLFFFVLLRVAAYRSSLAWLTAFNRAGAPLVDRFSACIRQGLSRLSDRSYSDKTTLVVGLLTIASLATILNLVISVRRGI